MKPAVLRTSVCLCLLLCLPGWGQTPRARGGSSYAGSESCEPCHDGLLKTVSESAHGQLLESEDPSQHGCESCHGPGAAHISGNGDPQKILRFSDAPLEVVRARCGACHLTLMGEDAGHAKRSCLDCHSAHHYQQKKFILVMEKEQLCRRCH